MLCYISIICSFFFFCNAAVSSNRTKSPARMSIVFDGAYKLSISNLDEFLLTNISTPLYTYTIFPNSSVQVESQTLPSTSTSTSTFRTTSTTSTRRPTHSVGIGKRDLDNNELSAIEKDDHDLAVLIQKAIIQIETDLGGEIYSNSTIYREFEVGDSVLTCTYILRDARERPYNYNIKCFNHKSDVLASIAPNTNFVYSKILKKFVKNTGAYTR